MIQIRQPRPNKTNKLRIAKDLVILPGTDNGIHGIIVNGVHMLHRIGLGQHRKDCAFGDLSIRKNIIADHERLAGIAAPNPAVTLNAINKKLPGAQVEGIGTGLPNGLHIGTVAFETALFLQRQILIQAVEP